MLIPWRWKHFLFRWDYAAISAFKEREKIGTIIYRVRKLADGRRYIYVRRGSGIKNPGVHLLDNVREFVPLTWFSEDDTFQAWTKIVKDRLAREDGQDGAS